MGTFKRASRCARIASEDCASAERHPLAGLVLGFAAVAGAFTVNMFTKPLDAVLVEFTNDELHLVDPDKSIGSASSVIFSIVSVVFLTVLIALMTDRVVAPRSGSFRGGASSPEGGALSSALTPDEPRGLKYALFGLLGDWFWMVVRHYGFTPQHWNSWIR